MRAAAVAVAQVVRWVAAPVEGARRVASVARKEARPVMPEPAIKAARTAPWRAPAGTVVLVVSEPEAAALGPAPLAGR